MKAKEILARARKENRTVTTEIEAGQLLTQLGINCVDTQLASTKERAVVVAIRMVLSAAKTPS
jgi:acyl-CoA synthetase (NDP forming)